MDYIFLIIVGVVFRVEDHQVRFCYTIFEKEIIILKSLWFTIGGAGIQIVLRLFCFIESIKVFEPIHAHLNFGLIDQFFSFIGASGKVEYTCPVFNFAFTLNDPFIVTELQFFLFS